MDGKKKTMKDPKKEITRKEKRSKRENFDKDTFFTKEIKFLSKPGICQNQNLVLVSSFLVSGLV